MVALLVVLASMLCATLALGSKGTEKKVNAPILETGPPTKELTRIVGGEHACRNQFRHHARIVGDHRFSWGGSLIKPTAVLTDGSISGYKQYTIHLGTVFWEGDDSAYTVESIWSLVHPEYAPREHFKNDVGVILLNVEVPLGKSIWPVKLPSLYEVGETFTGRRALITGFGEINRTGPIFQERLRFTEVTIIGNDLCKRFFKEDYISDSSLCAGNEKTAFCIGDYGGALVVESGTGRHYKQIGIASFMGGKCGKDIPGVYTRVTSHLEWIQSAAGDLNDWEEAEDYYYE